MLVPPSGARRPGAARLERDLRAVAAVPAAPDRPLSHSPGRGAARTRKGAPIPMSLAIMATVFAVIFPAELPDKTALASLVLGSRYRPSWVFTGVAAAFAVHAALA